MTPPLGTHGKDATHDVAIRITFSVPCQTSDGLKNDGDIWRAIEAIKQNPKGWRLFTNGVMLLYANCGDVSAEVLDVTTYREA